MSMLSDCCSAAEEDAAPDFKFYNIAKQTWRDGNLDMHSQSSGHTPLVEWVLSYIRLFQSQDGQDSPMCDTSLARFGVCGFLSII